MAPRKGVFKHTTEARRRISSGLTGRQVSEETREKIRAAHLGKKRPSPSAETIDKRRDAMRKRWADPAYKKRLSVALIGHRGPEPGVLSRALRGRKRSAEKRQKDKERANRQWADPEYREQMRKAHLGHVPGPDTRRKLREARLRQVLPVKMTSIEVALRDEFVKRRLRFEMHKTMFGRYQPDFVFEEARLVVQADGDYWHSLPKAVAKDFAFNARAASEGWTVIRFGESVIKHDAATCGRTVAKFVRSHHP